jgi:hypothetical protein
MNLIPISYNKNNKNGDESRHLNRIKKEGERTMDAF